MTTSVSDSRAWYIIDVTTGGSLDSAEDGHELVLPTGREVVVTSHERPSTLTWRDAHPDTGTTGSGGLLALKSWIDNSTTINLTHHIDLPSGTSWRLVTARQELLDADVKAHARAWMERLARHGAATTGNT